MLGYSIGQGALLPAKSYCEIVFEAVLDSAWDDILKIVQSGLLSPPGIQLVTIHKSNALGSKIHTKLSPTEVDVFREKQTSFQLIKLVLSTAHFNEENSAIRGARFSIYAAPAIKRDTPEIFDINAVERFADTFEGHQVEDVLVGFDPFLGKYEMSVLGRDFVHWSGDPDFLSQIEFILQSYFLAHAFERENLLRLMISFSKVSKSVSKKMQKKVSYATPKVSELTNLEPFFRY